MRVQNTWAVAAAGFGTNQDSSHLVYTVIAPDEVAVKLLCEGTDAQWQPLVIEDGTLGFTSAVDGHLPADFMNLRKILMLHQEIHKLKGSPAPSGAVKKRDFTRLVHVESEIVHTRTWSIAEIERAVAGSASKGYFAVYEGEENNDAHERALRECANKFTLRRNLREEGERDEEE